MWERSDNQEVGLEAAILQRKRNSSLVKRARAENLTGLKHGTEATGWRLKAPAVGEHCVSLRRSTARTAGGITRDYADMSSANAGEKPAHRKPKGSSVKVICGGLVGP